MDVLDLGGQIDSCALLARATRWIHMRDWKELDFYRQVRSRRTDRQLCTAGARHAILHCIILFSRQGAVCCSVSAMETATSSPERMLVGSLIQLIQAETRLIMLGWKASDQNQPTLRTQPLPWSPRSAADEFAEPLQAYFVLGYGGELRAPAACGRVVGIYHRGFVRSVHDNDEVLYADVRPVVVREAGSALTPALERAWLRLENWVSLTIKQQNDLNADASTDGWRRRSEYFERICRDLTHLARERDRLLNQTRERLNVARRSQMHLRRVFVEAFAGHLLCFESSRPDQGSEGASSEAGASKCDAASASEPVFFTGQPLVLLNDALPNDLPADGDEKEHHSWRWLTHDLFGRFRIPLGRPPAIQSLGWLYIPVVDDVGNAIRVEEIIEGDPPTTDPKTKRYLHTKPIRLAPDVEREVQFRLTAAKRCCTCIRETACAGAPVQPDASGTDARSANRHALHSCLTCSAWALTWPGVFEVTSDMLRGWSNWQVHQNRSDENTFTFAVDGTERVYRAWSRHERDVIVACLRHWQEEARAGAHDPGAALPASGVPLSTGSMFQDK